MVLFAATGLRFNPSEKMKAHHTASTVPTPDRSDGELLSTKAPTPAAKSAYCRRNRTGKSATIDWRWMQSISNLSLLSLSLLTGKTNREA